MTLERHSMTGLTGLEGHASNPSWCSNVESPTIDQKLKRLSPRVFLMPWANRRIPRSDCSLESPTAFTVPSHSSHSPCCHWEVTVLRYPEESDPRKKQES